MSAAHLAELRSHLERRHWVICGENCLLTSDESLYWKICRPNGDHPLTLEFTAGHAGLHGHIKCESIDESIACDVVGHSEIPYLYFGKFHGKFQAAVAVFANAIDAIQA